MTNGDSASSNGYFVYSSDGAPGYGYGNYSTGIYPQNVGTPNFYPPVIASESWLSNSVEFYAFNYSATTISLTQYSLPSSVYYGFGSVYISHNATITVQWTRIRAYPPNGVMPSIYIS